MRHVMVILGFAVFLTAAPALGQESDDLPTLEEIASLLPTPPQCLCAPYERYYDAETQAQLSDAQELERERRYEDAFTAYLALAESGNAEAQVRLSRYFFRWSFYEANDGRLYHDLDYGLLRGDFHGRKPEYPDSGEGARIAIDWLERAAAQGHVLAMAELGGFNRQGTGGEIHTMARENNATRRLAYDLLAANCNNAEGQFYLGRSLEYGINIVRDAVAAWFWLTVSSENDHPRAMFYLNTAYYEHVGSEYIPHHSTPTVREAGEAIARDWLDANPGPVCETGSRY